MLGLFNNLNARNRGINGFPRWDYVRTGLRLNLDKTNKYYRSGAYATQSSHELVKMLYGLQTRVDLDLLNYYKRVDNRCMVVAQQLGYTTMLSKGRIFSNVFFRNSKEVIIVTDDPFDPAFVDKHWRDVRPVEVLRHGFDQLDCFPCNGTVNSKRVSVFVVNLPMLAVQYRAYRNWQQTYIDDDSGRNSIQHFLFAYPLNNMIYSALDHSVFNRFVKLNVGIEPNDNSFRHPFSMTNFSMKVDDELKLMVKYLKNSRMSIDGIANVIPMITKSNLRELMRMPDLVETRQIGWAVYLARIDFLMFFLSFDSVLKENRSELNSIKYELRANLMDGSIQEYIPPDMFEMQKKKIEKILNL